MFGYVLPCKQQMGDDIFDEYRSFYCGLCKQLAKSYGSLSRFLLNYDLVLLAIMADAQSGEEGQLKYENCLANPFEKRPVLHSTKGLELAADSLVMLSYHKLRDNLEDEGFLKKIPYGITMPYMKRIYAKACKKRPELSISLEEQMDKQHSVENNNSNIVDEACEATGKMCEALFAEAGANSSQRLILGRLGLFTGQIIYLLDAAEDYNEDKKSGSYNVYANLDYCLDEVVENSKKRCRMAAGELALCYNLLEFKNHKDLTDNIFFLGLPHSINNCGKKRNKRGNRHGKIESV